MPDGPRSSPSDYLAAERTFLAWIRTGLALMGLGFVVARFGLFLQELQPQRLQQNTYGLSFWGGTALIGIGVAVNLLSARSHFRLIRELNRGGPAVHGPSWLAIAVAILLAVVGLALAAYLASMR